MDIRTQLGKKWNESQFLNNSNSLWRKEFSKVKSEINQNQEKKQKNTGLKEFGFREENNWAYLHVTEKKLRR